MNDSEALRILILFGTAKEWRPLFLKKTDRWSRRRLYKAYIISEAWKKKRKAAIARATELCQCGGLAVQAHHLTYARLGDENDSDLQAVCLSCHKQEHRKLAEKLKATGVSI